MYEVHILADDADVQYIFQGFATWNLGSISCMKPKAAYIALFRSPKNQYYLSSYLLHKHRHDQQQWPVTFTKFPQQISSPSPLGTRTIRSVDCYALVLQLRNSQRIQYTSVLHPYSPVNPSTYPSFFYSMYLPTLPNYATRPVKLKREGWPFVSFMRFVRGGIFSILSPTKTVSKRRSDQIRCKEEREAHKQKNHTTHTHHTTALTFSPFSVKPLLALGH